MGTPIGEKATPACERGSAEGVVLFSGPSAVEAVVSFIFPFRAEVPMSSAA